MNKEKYTQLLEDGELFSYINNLQQRIDKAIFFINTTFDNYLVDDYIKNNLLEILKGRDKNVSSEIKRDN